jgi:hypothetical protein
MRGDTHVRFGGRARETDPGQPGHRARARPNRSDTAAIMPDHGRPPIPAAQHHVRRSGTPQVQPNTSEVSSPSVGPLLCTVYSMTAP